MVIKNLVKKNYRYWILNLALMVVVWFGVKWLISRPVSSGSMVQKSAAIQLTGNSIPTPPVDGVGRMPGS